MDRFQVCSQPSTVCHWELCEVQVYFMRPHTVRTPSVVVPVWEATNRYLPNTFSLETSCKREVLSNVECGPSLFFVGLPRFHMGHSPMCNTCHKWVIGVLRLAWFVWCIFKGSEVFGSRKVLRLSPLQVFILELTAEAQPDSPEALSAN